MRLKLKLMEMIKDESHWEIDPLFSDMGYDEPFPSDKLRTILESLVFMSTLSSCFLCFLLFLYRKMTVDYVLSLYHVFNFSFGYCFENIALILTKENSCRSWRNSKGKI